MFSLSDTELQLVDQRLLLLSHYNVKKAGMIAPRTMDRTDSVKVFVMKIPQYKN